MQFPSRLLSLPPPKIAIPVDVLVVVRTSSYVPVAAPGVVPPANALPNVPSSVASAISGASVAPHVGAVAPFSRLPISGTVLLGIVEVGSLSSNLEYFSGAFPRLRGVLPLLLDTVKERTRWRQIMECVVV